MQNVNNDYDYDGCEEQIYLKSSINIHNITHCDMKNGDGLRVVLWVAGCTHKCPECQNPITWDENRGIPFTQWEQAEFWEELDKPWIQGATFSGGDPLHPRNREYIGRMMQQIKQSRPDKDIWLYTGYRLEKRNTSNMDFYLEDTVTGEYFSYPFLQYIDVLVDGRFECEVRRRDIELSRNVKWCGSSNQRIINVPQTLQSGHIIIKED